ncbi:MAG: anhydro-N-acetylmuramic acid kinase [Burkholderiaceae bacterium]
MPASPQPPSRFIGLMSGTSIDAVDGVLLEIADTAPPMQRAAAAPCRTLAFASRPFDAGLRAELEALQAPGTDELARAAIAANRLSDLYAGLTADLLRQAGLAPADIAAVGAHGQTVRHRPELGYTLQLLNAPRLAERCGIAVVSDLRSADVAAGGQGAPLVPAFHAQVFGDALERRAIVNIGGIANLTVLPAGAESVVGYDTGPGNTLLDAWCRRHTGAVFDRDGAWARQGRVDAALLAACLADAYFARPAPKSTGRDHFHPGWLQAALDRAAPAARPEDVQATLLELTAATIAQACRSAAAQRIFVCGGGVNNRWLMERLAQMLAPVPVGSTAELGIDPQAVEASAFAWLAARRIRRQAGNLPSVTGAAGPRVLGALSEAPEAPEPEAPGAAGIRP